MERSHQRESQTWSRGSSFQSLSGIMERSHFRLEHGRSPGARVSIPFRDYGTFSLGHSCLDTTARYTVSIPFRDYGTFSRAETAHLSHAAFRFNPFQGLWNVLTWFEASKYTCEIVSIPFRDYGTFSLILLPDTPYRPILFQSLSGIMERSHVGMPGI